MDVVASTSSTDIAQRWRSGRRVHPTAERLYNDSLNLNPSPSTSNRLSSAADSSPSSDTPSTRSSISSRPTDSNSTNDETTDKEPPPLVRLFPVSNGYAVAAAGAVILYSATFLFYAQRHIVVLLIMTGLIGVFIIFLYALGILSFIYLMLKISSMEENDSNKPEIQRVNVAYLTVNSSYGSDMISGSGTMALRRDWAPPKRPDSRTPLKESVPTDQGRSNGLGRSSVTEMKF